MAIAAGLRGIKAEVGRRRVVWREGGGVVREWEKKEEAIGDLQKNY